jgi:enoyl-CoA hydratase/carnithine racemase
VSVDYGVRNGVAWVTINRPEARNSLNKAVRDGLFESVRTFNRDDTAPPRWRGL